MDGIRVTFKECKDGEYADIARVRGWLRVWTNLDELMDAIPADKLADTLKAGLDFIQPDNTETLDEAIEKLPDGFCRALFISWMV